MTKSIFSVRLLQTHTHLHTHTQRKERGGTKEEMKKDKGETKKCVGSAIYYLIIIIIKSTSNLFFIFCAKAFKCGVVPCSFEVKI